MTLKVVPVNTELRGTVMCEEEHGHGLDRPRLNAKSGMLLAVGSWANWSKRFFVLFCFCKMETTVVIFQSCEGWNDYICKDSGTQ